MCTLLNFNTNIKAKFVLQSTEGSVPGGALTYETDVRVPPSTSDVGVFRWQITSKKGGLSVTKRTKKGGLSVRGFQKYALPVTKWQKIDIFSQNFDKFSEIVENSTFLTEKLPLLEKQMKKWGL